MRTGGVALVDREVETLEDVFDHEAHHLVRDSESRMAALERRWLEESAVEVRDASEPPCGLVTIPDGGIQAAEEERRQDVREEVALLEAIEEEPPLAVQPPLLLDE